jgi:hypothetical protein
MDMTVTAKQELIPGHEPQMGLDTKTDWLTDRQSQCDFDFDFYHSKHEMTTDLQTVNFLIIERFGKITAFDSLLQLQLQSNNTTHFTVLRAEMHPFAKK